MCDGCVPMGPPWGPYEGSQTQEDVKEDVRATKPHTVSVTLLVDAEDAGRAVQGVASAYAGTGIQVVRISALPYEPEDDTW